MPYLFALALTLLVEVPVYVAALTVPARVRPARAGAAALMVNCVTHPPLWWFLAHVPAADYWAYFAAAEAAVCVVEALLLRRLLRLTGPVPYAASVTANAASVIAGLLLI
ncbi:hypothetical protein [Streptomyces sp. RKAG293]|uniref:hypothetical protein n=1 Tax=Streptomyces sp. RKAG293 TaxID=2893403 RepID=UPI0020346538|nr:hypothetical protein [Streptomyces sp. RKAG293]MCM2423670.1 hypothetical protein [Streptomyces sp. RKAG293]